MTATQLSLTAPLASPNFTGTPSAVTAAAGTNSTQLATTAFVTAATNAIAVPAYGGIGSWQLSVFGVVANTSYAAANCGCSAGTWRCHSTIAAGSTGNSVNYVSLLQRIA